MFRASLSRKFHVLFSSFTKGACFLLANSDFVYSENCNDIRKQPARRSFFKRCSELMLQLENLTCSEKQRYRGIMINLRKTDVFLLLSNPRKFQNTSFKEIVRYFASLCRQMVSPGFQNTDTARYRFPRNQNTSFE